MEKILFLVSSLVFYRPSFACQPELMKIQSDSFEVEYISYKTKNTSHSDAVIIMPPTGGVNLIDRSYAKKFCKSGSLAIVLKSWTRENEVTLDIETHAEFYLNAQKAIDLVIQAYDHLNLKMLGTSVGGIHAAIAASRHPETLKKVFFIVAGANIANILATSTQKVLLQAKSKRFQLYGFKDTKEYEDRIREALLFEPLNLSYSKRNNKYGMILSKNDTVVPTKYQYLLKKILSAKSVHVSNRNHKNTIICSWLFHSKKIVNFFRD